MVVQNRSSRKKKNIADEIGEIAETRGKAISRMKQHGTVNNK